MTKELNLEALRPWVTALVLLNVVFVHLTEAVPVGLLIPLYVFTALAPTLARFQGRRLWRNAWNLAVLLVFVLLLLDLRRKHISALLEHGMLLAALSQVHLLNNLDSKQRPDLLFFNSFLLAFVTAFFSQDVAFSLVFALYVALLLPAVQLYTMLASGVMVPGPGAESHRELAKHVFRSSLPHTALALTATALLFVFLPRDFNREGWVTQELLKSRSEPGYSEQVQLGRANTSHLSERIVFRVQGQAPLPTHWRTATYSNYHRRTWRAVQQEATAGITQSDPRWRFAPDGALLRHPTGAGHRTLLVQLRDPMVRRLPVPLSTTRLQMLPPLETDRIRIQADGTLMHLDSREVVQKGQAAAYSISVMDPGTFQVAPPEHTPWLKRSLVLSKRAQLPRELTDLADTLHAEAKQLHGHQLRPIQLAHHISHHLQSEFTYALPGQSGAARDLADFIGDSKAGHCEYFASALVLMLRYLDVPCRMASGFLGMGAEDGVMIVRRKHAHAWAEVLDPDDGWVVVDATPASGDTDLGASAGWFDELGQQLQEWWKAVTTFDAAGQQNVLAWLLRLPGRIGAWLLAHPMSVLLVGMLLICWARRRRRPHPEVLRLEKALRQAGVERQPEETPRQAMKRALLDRVPTDVHTTLVQAVASHEASRYRHPIS